MLTEAAWISRGHKQSGNDDRGGENVLDFHGGLRCFCFKLGYAALSERGAASASLRASQGG